MSGGRITVKRPDKEDAMELLPAVAAIAALYLLNNRAGGSRNVALIPALVAIGAWIALKGLRYVPQ
jgi:hypothetical protein